MSSLFADGIQAAAPEDFPTLLTVWEASVRATNHFITEANIAFFKTLVRDQALPALSLFCMRDRYQKAIGFIGVDQDKVEMLFIDPAWRGKNIGRQLFSYAVMELGVTQVDVNEQNEQAVGFYQKMGFRVTGRSALDGMGKHYPLLHMQR